MARGTETRIVRRASVSGAPAVFCLGAAPTEPEARTVCVCVCVQLPFQVRRQLAPDDALEKGVGDADAGLVGGLGGAELVREQEPADGEGDAYVRPIAVLRRAAAWRTLLTRRRGRQCGRDAHEEQVAAREG